MSTAESTAVPAPAGRRPRVAGGAAVAQGRRWLGERLSTTPGRLWLIGVSLALGAVLFGAIATSAERSRAHAAQTIRTQTEPLLVQAAMLYTSLSDANATATATFLQGGIEPPVRTARYTGDLNRATTALAALAGTLAGTPGAEAAIARLTREVPAYTGIIAAARANNRQGFPVGAAYLRQASALLVDTILPAADQLYALVAGRLSGAYGTGTADPAIVALVAVAVAALVLLVIAQRFIARASRRVFNIAMVAATVVLAVVAVWALAGLLGERSSLISAQRQSDVVETLAATRVLVSRAQSDQSLALVNRGSDETDPRDFAAVLAALTRRGGLIDELRVLGRDTVVSGDVARIDRELAAYQAASAAVTTREQQGFSQEAAALAAARSAPAAAQLDGDLAASTAAAQRRFTARVDDATGSLTGLWPAIPLLTVLALALCVAGLRPRIEEYR